MNLPLNKFIKNTLEKNCLTNSQGYSKVDFLDDICGFFDLSHGFIYEIRKGNVYHKSHCHEIPFTDSLDHEIDLKEILGIQLLSELCSKEIIICDGEMKKTPLEEKLCEIFISKTLVFIPILNQHYELSAFVGVSDRRSKIRKGDISIKNTCSVLSLLAKQVKLEMYQVSTQNAELILNNVLDNVNIDIYANDYYTHDMLYANKSMAAPYGGVENMLGKKCWQAIFTDKSGQCDFCPQKEILDDDGNPTKAYTWDYQRMMDGSWFRVFSSCIPWTDGRLAHLVASVDITENKRNQELIEKLAQFDYLTGLPNRRSLEDNIEEFIKDKALFAPEFYVLFCDLDGFKIINDTIGHDGGDALLISISKMLDQFPKELLRAYRHGGDEFIILLKDLHSKDLLKKSLDELFDVFCRTYTYKDHEMRCGCSIGISHFPSTAQTQKKLFYLADSAMYSAKQNGKGTVRLSKDMNNLTFDEYFKK